MIGPLHKAESQKSIVYLTVYYAFWFPEVTIRHIRFIPMYTQKNWIQGVNLLGHKVYCRMM